MRQSGLVGYYSLGPFWLAVKRVKVGNKRHWKKGDGIDGITSGGLSLYMEFSIRLYDRLVYIISSY